ncbi:hypothetical protein U1707_14290 [Sphingomonas sp. PB2P12]|uniref:hypothetical protein n=1 Tax=Sphingomonas sandaracina TaxID=3096157 RepID=UPI002FCC5FC4
MPENDYPEWSMGTNYAVGARVIQASTHRVYESTASPNLGNDPAGASGKWLDVGATNRWAMFDQALGSATTAANTILAKVNVASVNAVALLDVMGATVRVEAPGYDRTTDVTAGAITFLDLPNTTGRVIVTITGPDQVSVGTLLVGRLLDLGITEASPTAGITDYSRKVVDEFGDVTVVERAWSKRMAAKALIRTDAIDVVANRIAAVRARPSLWIGQRGIDSLTIYGFFKDFSIEVGLHVSKLSLSIEGLSKAVPLAPIVPGDAVAWPDVTDPLGTKPADNADVTADAYKAAAGKSIKQTIDMLDAIVAGNGPDQEAAQAARDAAIAARDVANVAAENAETARDDSQAARDAASLARDAALGASTQAQTARDQAGAAGAAAADASTQAKQSAAIAAQRVSDATGFAQTASGQATIATQKADAAGKSASTASAQATIATTQAGDASASAASAATSSSDALGSAQSATTQAGVAATSAKASAFNANLPLTFAQKGALYSSTSTWGTTTPLPDSAFASAATGWVYRKTGNYYLTLNRAAPLKGRLYRLQTRLRVLDANATYSLDYEWSNTGTNALGGSYSGFTTITPAMGWITRDDVVDATGSSFVYINPQLRGTVATGGTLEVDYFRLLDLTEVSKAEAAATASANSASSAQTSQTASGTSASAAKTSETNAATSAGSANTYANNASASATTAQGSANTATTQAGVSTQAKTDAQTAATSASGSASTASSKADAAGVSASAAQASATAAGTSAGSANTSASQASTSAQNAAGSASSAVTQAGVAATSAKTALDTAISTIPSALRDRNMFRVAWAGLDTRPPDLDSRWAFDGEQLTISTNGSNAAAYDTSHAGSIQLVAGHKHRLTAIWRVPNAGGKTSVGGTLFFIGMDANGVSKVTPGLPIAIASGEPGWGTNTGYETIAIDVDNSSLMASGATRLRGLIRLVANDGNPIYQVKTLALDDITSESAAAQSAAAASTSAQSAATKADAAGVSASSAQTSATNASTSAGSAQGYAGQASTSASAASTSASSASGSANTASQNAGLATQAKSDAAGFATASAGSASAASSKANEAGQSATAASQAKLDAQAARDTSVSSAGLSQQQAALATDKAAAALASAEISARRASEAGLALASINDASGAFATQLSSTSQRVTTLSAQILDRKGNLLPNGSGEGGINNGKPGSWRAGGGVWVFTTSPVWGPELVVYNTTAPVISVDSPIIPCSAGAWYTASADLLIFSDAPNPYCYVDIAFVRANGQIIYGGGRVSQGQRDFGSPGFRDATWAKLQAPADAVSMFLRGVFARDDGGTHRVLGIREAKIEYGQGPYSPYSQEATQQISGAQLTTTQAAVADVQGRAATYWRTTAVAGNNRAQVTIYADANGGAGVDFVGDVSISGNLLVGGSVGTGAIMPDAFTGAVSATFGDQYIQTSGASGTSTTYDTGVLNIFSAGGRLRTDVYVDAFAAAGGPGRQLYVQLYRRFNGYDQPISRLVGITTLNGPCVLWAQESPGGGLVGYFLRFTLSISGQGTAAYTLSQPQMQVMEFKR